MDDQAGQGVGQGSAAESGSGAAGDSLDQQRRAFVSKLVDRIATDPAFRQALVDNSQSALDASGLGAEYEALTSAYAQLPESERDQHQSHGLCTWFLTNAAG